MERFVTALSLGLLSALPVWPAEVEPAHPVDNRDHWSFQPLQVAPGGHSIDAFISSALKQKGLSMSPPASRREWLRRATFDLTGLPPTPEEMDQFLSDTEATAYAKVLSRLLASERYGERWAQHWLDVVRYADTHGFEVNTERPNAWPYRDFVIRAFNQDTPYDQFIRQQIAGDAMGEDAATGFLVTASVLLPGQIGKDEPSIRLARQDSLDEIVNNIGQTFLGLSIGCARCHDHKFDPITSKDYYAMQAFVSGVHYDDRPVRNAKEELEIAQELKALETSSHEISNRLEAWQPPATTRRIILIDDEDTTRTTALKKSNGPGANPPGTKRGYRDDPGASDHVPNLSGGRYTWWNNVPDEDVFTWNPGVEGSFRIWLSWGVHGSGVHTHDARYVLDLDGELSTTEDQTEIGNADQYYFANVSSGTSEQVPLWSGLRDAGLHQLRMQSRIILRGGKTGTGITADVLVLEESGPAAPFPHLRAPVSPTLNVERFTPVETKLVRFTALSTTDNNRHQPCIDELEIFSNDNPSKNLALASNGAIARSSGDYPDIAQHQLPHIHDGKYGNSQSWISNQFGSGWVEIELPEVAKIERIVWSRDREGKFKDRLADRYRIEVALTPGQWITVAQSDDRCLQGTAFDETAAIQRTAPTNAGKNVEEDVSALSRIEKRRAELAKRPMVFAGIFRDPDLIHLLSRGDPEQPKEEVGPSIPVVFGKVTLPKTTTEQQRRLALAEWIANAGNPLTARVMVNRIWQGHFGSGLVQTPSDFGLSGMKPTHPELLDWLAAEFIHSGWSIKHMHQLIMLSEAYRQRSGIGSPSEEVKAALALDGESRLLWRFPARRLEAETIRDSILAVAGQLNFTMYGSGFDLFNQRGGLSGFDPIETFTPQNQRRMIYAHKVRREPETVFGAFDCPDAGQSTAVRRASTTPIQSLNLFNSQFTLTQSEALAQRAAKETGSDTATQVKLIYQLVLNRDPSMDELQDAIPAVNAHGLATLCRAIFNSNEFLFLP